MSLAIAGVAAGGDRGRHRSRWPPVFVVQARRAESDRRRVVAGRAPATCSVTRDAAALRPRTVPRIDFLHAATGRRRGGRGRPAAGRQRGHRRPRRGRPAGHHRGRRRRQPHHLDSPVAGRHVHRDRRWPRSPARRTCTRWISTTTATSTSPWPASACSSPTTRRSARSIVLENDGRQRLPVVCSSDKVARVSRRARRRSRRRRRSRSGGGAVRLRPGRNALDGEPGRLAVRQPRAAEPVGPHQRGDWPMSTATATSTS